MGVIKLTRIDGTEEHIENYHYIPDGFDINGVHLIVLKGAGEEEVMWLSRAMRVRGAPALLVALGEGQEIEMYRMEIDPEGVPAYPSGKAMRCAGVN